MNERASTEPAPVARRDPRLGSLAIAVGVAGCVIGALIWARLTRGPEHGLAFDTRSPLPGFENALHDGFFRLRQRLAAPSPPRDVVVVAIDEVSMQELGQWPWPRSVHGDLVHTLREAGAAVIGFDVLFADAEASPGGENDAYFAQAIREAGNVVLAEDVELTQQGTARIERRIRPHAPFASAAAATGIVKVDLDSDGAVRRSYLARSLDDGTAIPAFARVVAERARAARGLSVDASDPIATFHVPHPLAEPVTLDFVGPRHTIPTVSYTQALDAGASLPRGFFHDKIVLVGFDLTAQADLASLDHFDYPLLGQGSGQMAGVEIHASLADTLLRERYLRDAFAVPLVGYAATALAGAWLLATLGVWSGSLAFAALVVAFAAAHFAAFVLGGWLAPLGLPLLGLAIQLPLDRTYRVLVLDRQKRFVQKAFSHYVSPKVVERLIAEPERLKLEGELYVGTVMFSDLVGFTTLSERTTPAELHAFLTEYFTEMVDILISNDGTLDKLIGDAIMGFFGIPVRNPRHAHQAALTAFQMQRRLVELNRDWQARGLPELGMRIGLNTGEVLAGNMGTRTLFNYTVLGDTVNLSSRLEGANKEYGTRILIAESTWTAIRDEFEGRQVDLLRVKGKKQPVAVFELIGPRGTMDERQRRSMALFECAFAAYQQAEFAAALALLDQRRAFGDDPTAGVLRKRCEQSLADPPPPDWDGVFTLKTK